MVQQRGNEAGHRLSDSLGRPGEIQGRLDAEKGKLQLKSGSKLSKIALGKIFYNPDMPEMKDYYEPWTYNYEHLTNAGEKKHQPVARPKSAVTGETMNLEWGPNWEDDLAGAHVTGPKDPNIEKSRKRLNSTSSRRS